MRFPAVIVGNRSGRKLRYLTRNYQFLYTYIDICVVCIKLFLYKLQNGVKVMHVPDKLHIHMSVAKQKTMPIN